MATCPINMKCILHKLLKSQEVWIVDSHRMLLKSVQQKFRINETDCFFHKNIVDQILMGSIRTPYVSFNFNLLPKIDKWLQGHLFETLIFCQENTNSSLHASILNMLTVFANSCEMESHHFFPKNIYIIRTSKQHIEVDKYCHSL